MQIYRQIKIDIEYRNNITNLIIKSAYAIVDHDDIWNIYPLYNKNSDSIDNNNNIMPSSEWKTNITIINHKNTFYQ